MKRHLNLTVAALSAVLVSVAVSVAAYAHQDQSSPSFQGRPSVDAHARLVDDSAVGVPDAQFPPPTMTMLADGVYHFFGLFSSSLVVVGDDGVLITDPSNPLRAQQLQEEIAKITDAPVTRIVLTHEHFDHVGGTGLFPDARIVCHRNCAPVFALSTLGDVPDQVDEPFDTEFTVSAGGIEVQMRYLGPGDGDATIVVYLPEEQIVVTSDLYEPRALTDKNWVDDKNFTGVRRILNTISEWPIAHAINAHSPGTDPIDLMENVAYYNDLYDAVYAAYVEAAAMFGPYAYVGLYSSLPESLELPAYADWTNYDTSFGRHVQRMLMSITHGD